MKKLIFIYLLMGTTISLKSQNFSIAGNIQTANNIALCKTIVTISDEDGNTLTITNTDLEGNYIFENLLPNQTYKISAKRIDQSANGVSIFDLTLLRNHLAGIRNLDDPFTLITLDINDSGSLTTFDILMIQKLILGQEQNLAASDWKFFSSNAIIDHSLDLQIGIRVYENLTNSITNADFIGYKIGDADQSVEITCN